MWQWEARVTPPRLEPHPMLTPTSTRWGNMGGQPELLLEHEVRYQLSGMLIRRSIHLGLKPGDAGIEEIGPVDENEYEVGAGADQLSQHQALHHLAAARVPELPRLPRDIVPDVLPGHALASHRRSLTSDVVIRVNFSHVDISHKFRERESGSHVASVMS